MKRIIFDFSVSPALVRNERQSVDIPELRLSDLLGLCEGRIFIFFEPQREYIILETRIIDYLFQLREVISKIDGGTHKIVAVSEDYYSNNLQFTYLPQYKTLEICDNNNGEFKIATNYKKFRQEFTKFFSKTVSELIILYPELHENDAFRRACK